MNPDLGLKSSRSRVQLFQKLVASQSQGAALAFARGKLPPSTVLSYWASLDVRVLEVGVHVNQINDPVLRSDLR